jgi:hypothetical protein
LSSVSSLRPDFDTAIANEVCRKTYFLIPEKEIRLFDSRPKALFRKFQSVRYSSAKSIGMSFAFLQQGRLAAQEGGRRNGGK